MPSSHVDSPDEGIFMFAKSSLFILVVASVVLFASTSAAAQLGADRAQVMVLGVYHFANPNADMLKSNFPDHLSPKKQKEIEILLDLLGEFKPTKIVVEAVPEDETVSRSYSKYLENSYQLTANEIEQIGFRLAKRSGHKRLYQADHKIGMDLSSVMATASETRNARFLAEFETAMKEIQAMQKRHESMPVLDVLIEMNEPKLQDRTRDLYLQLLRVKGKNNFVGADALSGWYQRNFRIFSNIAQLIESPADRVLVIFGQGHVPYLRDAVMSFPDLQLIEVNDYLKKTASRLLRPRRQDSIMSTGGVNVGLTRTQEASPS